MEICRYGIFFSVVVFYFCRLPRARDVSIFSSFLCRFPCFLSCCCGREAFRSLLLLLLLLHKAIFSIDERFVIGFRGKVCSANEKKLKKGV